MRPRTESSQQGDDWILSEHGIDGEHLTLLLRSGVPSALHFLGDRDIGRIKFLILFDMSIEVDWFQVKASSSRASASELVSDNSTKANWWSICQEEPCPAQFRLAKLEVLQHIKHHEAMLWRHIPLHSSYINLRNGSLQFNASHCLPQGGHYQFRSCGRCGPAGNNTFATVDVHFGDLAPDFIIAMCMALYGGWKESCTR